MACGVGWGLFTRQVSALCMSAGAPYVTEQLCDDDFGCMIEGNV